MQRPRRTLERSNGGETDRGSISPKAALTLVIGLFVAALVTAFLLPVGVDELNADTTTTITQDVGEEVEVNAALNSTLDSTDGTNATYTLNTSSGDSETNTIAVGSETTYTTLSEGNVTVNVTAANNAANATADFTYANDYAWSDGSSALWGIIDMIIVLAVFLFLVAMAMAAMGRSLT